MDDRATLARAAARLYDAGDLKEALAKFERCWPLFDQEAQRTTEFADFCGNFGAALAESGNLKLAQNLFGQALATYGAHGRTGDTARIEFNLGNVYRYMNSWQPAYDAYRRALSAYQTANDAHGEGQCRTALATLFAGAGLFPWVREQLEKLEKLPREVQDEPPIAWSWRFQRAKIALYEGKTKEAMTLFTEALALARQIGDAGYIQETALALAEVQRQLGLVADIVPALERAYEASKARQDKDVLDVTLELARALAAKGEGERAVTFYDEILPLVDRGRGQLDGGERFRWMERMAGISQEFCRLLFGLGRYERAFEVSERGQGRVLLDLMFRHQIKLQSGRSIRSAGNGRVLVDAPTMAEIRQAAADARTAVLKLLVTPETTLAWLLRDDGKLESWTTDAAAPPLECALKLMLWSASDGLERGEIHPPLPGERAAWSEVQCALSALYDALFPPHIRRWLEDREGRLLIVPHRAYFGLPWSALGPNGGTALGTHWEIGVVPSLGVFTQLDRRRAPEGWRGLGHFTLPAVAIGDCGPQTVEAPLVPDGSRQRISFSELPGTSEEVQRVIEIMGGIKFVGKAAHVAGVRAVMGTAGIVHFATHGFWNPAIGDLSFLVLSPSPARARGQTLATGEPGALFAYQVMGDDFSTQAELATLSGCQTGLGSSHPDTYISLASSFLVAGARSVLVSLWPIRDDATTAFMEELYTELRKGRSPADALRRAQDEMARSALWGDGWNWSGFQLLGNPFHSLAADAADEKVPGPAFCGGDLMWTGAVQAGDLLPLEIFADRRQTRHTAWLVRDGKVQELTK